MCVPMLAFLPSAETMASLTKTVEAINKIVAAIAELKLEDCWNTIVDGILSLGRWFIDILTYLFPFLGPYLKPAKIDDHSPPSSPTPCRSAAVSPTRPASPVRSRSHGSAVTRPVSPRQGPPTNATYVGVPVGQAPSSKIIHVHIPPKSSRPEIDSPDGVDGPRGHGSPSPKENRRRRRQQARENERLESILNCRQEHPPSLDKIKGKSIIEDVPSDEDVSACNTECKAPAPCPGPFPFPIPATENLDFTCGTVGQNANTHVPVRSQSNYPEYIHPRDDSLPTSGPKSRRMTEDVATSRQDVATSSQHDQTKSQQQSQSQDQSQTGRNSRTQVDPLSRIKLKAQEHAQQHGNNNDAANTVDYIYSILSADNAFSGFSPEELQRQRQNMISVMQGLGI